MVYLYYILFKRERLNCLLVTKLFKGEFVYELKVWLYINMKWREQTSIFFK